MSDLSPILGLPYIQPAQAQKHVTHNEALQTLDLFTQLTVADRDRSSPPQNPHIGDRHIIGAEPDGEWAGHENQIAIFIDNTWQFYLPLPGMRATIVAENILLLWDGTQWRLPTRLTDEFQNLGSLGVGTTANSTNRLSVASPTTLLTHTGDDHRLVINKAAAANTASLVFQSNWSGHAEMGLAGGTDFTVKVSPDGGAFATALQAEAASGRILMPAGLSFGGATLEHYDQGSWAPRLTFGGADTGISYAVQYGTYMRLGDLVLVQAALELTDLGSVVGAAAIADLPFGPAASDFPGQVVFYAGGQGLSGPICTVTGAATLRLMNCAATGHQDLTESNFAGSANLKVSALYRIA